MTLEVRLPPDQLEALAELVAAKLERNLHQDAALRTYGIDEAAQVYGVDPGVMYALARSANPQGWRKVGREWRINHDDLARLGLPRSIQRKASSERELARR